jgi:glutathione S-transferase
MQTLGIQFEEKLTPFIESSNWKEFRKFSPNGLVPCLIDGEDHIWDSLAIIEYLAEKHPEVWPSESSTRAWARCAAAEMHSGFLALRNQCPMSCALKVKLHEQTEALHHDIARIDELWSEGIKRSGGPFLAGNKFTAIDAFYAPVVFRIQTFGLAMSESSLNYVNHMLSLASMQRWLKEAINEPWREIAHDKEIAESGVIVSDLRGG